MKLQPYRQQTLQIRGIQKLAPKYYGPFQVVAAVGHVAYKLALPSLENIHDIFHVSQLELFHGTLPMSSRILGGYNAKSPHLISLL